jgi:hypothetical protein
MLGIPYLIGWAGGEFLKLISYKREKQAKPVEFFNKIAQRDSSLRSRDSSLRSE